MYTACLLQIARAFGAHHAIPYHTHAIGIFGFGVLRVCSFRVKGFHGFQGLLGFGVLGLLGCGFSGLGPFMILRVIGILGFGVLMVNGLSVKGFRGFQGLWGFQFWGFRVGL